MKAYIGIDPGKESFITVINSNDVIEFYQIPMIGKEIDVKTLNTIVGNLDNPIYDSIYCVIEDVHALYGSSAGSTFEFGRIAGILEALLVAHTIPFVKVQPKTWQKVMWEGVPLQLKPSSTGKTHVNDTKSMSLMAAQRLFPEVDFRSTERCKKPNHNKVDSLLIASYCQRKFK